MNRRDAEAQRKKGAKVRKEAVPELSVQFGDKTPEYVRWYYRNFTREEFNRKHERWLERALEIATGD